MATRPLEWDEFHKTKKPAGTSMKSTDGATIAYTAEVFRLYFP